MHQTAITQDRIGTNGRPGGAPAGYGRSALPLVVGAYAALPAERDA